MQHILLRSIVILHTLFIIFVTTSPFINSNYLLVLHSIMIPLLLVHWILNDNTCSLTLIERKLKKELYQEEYSENDCFTCKLIEPVYDFVDNYRTFSIMIYSITLILWFISLGKLYCKYSDGSITDLKQLFIL